MAVNGTLTDKNGKQRNFKIAPELGVTNNNQKIPLGTWVCIIEEEYPISIKRNEAGQYEFSDNFPSMCNPGKQNIQDVIENEFEKIKYNY